MSGETTRRARRLPAMARKRIDPTPYFLILPTFAFVVLFTLYPTVASVYGSFFKHRLNVPKFREPVFTGLGNYGELFASTEFLQVVRNTVTYVAVIVPLTVVAALFFAIWLSRKRYSRFRIIVFHPTILPMVSAATVWLFFFTPDYGLFNAFLRLLGYAGLENWVSNPDLALWSLIVVGFWKDAGFYMIFFLAGIQNLPRPVFESARLDGAGPVRIFVSFTLPLLRRTTLFVTTVAVIGAFRAVDHVFVLTQGGPSNRSTLLLYHLWQVRFENLNVGHASTITVLLVILLLAFTVTNFIVSERKSDD